MDSVRATDAHGAFDGVLLRPGVAAFRGIPYAGRPGWGPPPPAPAAAITDARGHGPVPPQPGAEERETGPGSYRTVDVQAPWPPREPSPVLVWLCVGGNIVGRADGPPVIASRLPEAGVVLVAVQARLGPAGFAVVPDAPDNRAVLDWMSALRWVRERIAAFGGDPAAVTVAGQSAGGGAVAALLASPAAAGLFDRAIVMSSASPPTAVPPAARVTAAFADRLGVEPSAAALSAVPYDRLIAEVAATFGPRWRVDDPVQRVRNMREGPPFRIVDDDALGLGPVVPAIAAGAGRGVPVLIGSVAEEFTEAFAALDVSGGELDRAIAEIAPGGERLLGAYRRRMPDAFPGAVLGQAFTDAVFRRTPPRVAAARPGDATFLYEIGPFRAGPSARHGVDVAAVLGAGGAEGHGAGVPGWAARAAASAWVRFIATGSPGWEPWSGGGPAHRFGDGPVDARPELEGILADWGRD